MKEKIKEIRDFVLMCALGFRMRSRAKRALKNLMKQGKMPCNLFWNMSVMDTAERSWKHDSMWQVFKTCPTIEQIETAMMADSELTKSFLTAFARAEATN